MAFFFKLSHSKVKVLFSNLDQKICCHILCHVKLKCFILTSTKRSALIYSFTYLLMCTRKALRLIIIPDYRMLNVKRDIAYVYVCANFAHNFA